MIFQKTRNVPVGLFAGVLLGFFFWVIVPEVQAGTPLTPTVFSQFDRWWEEYSDATDAKRPAMVAAGSKLAAKRRLAMLGLIESDPKAAIELTFAEEYHSALPEPVAKLVEMHVRGLAELTVAGEGIVRRKVAMEEQSWQAFLFGPRLKLTSRSEIPIHGVVIDNKMAVDGSPLERFPARETLVNVLRQGEGKKNCPICDEPGTIPGAVGDILLWFDTEEHFVVCEKALIEKEMSSQEVP